MSRVPEDGVTDDSPPPPPISSCAMAHKVDKARKMRREIAVKSGKLLTSDPAGMK